MGLRLDLEWASLGFLSVFRVDSGLTQGAQAHFRPGQALPDSPNLVNIKDAVAAILLMNTPNAGAWRSGDELPLDGEIEHSGDDRQRSIGGYRGSPLGDVLQNFNDVPPLNVFGFEVPNVRNDVLLEKALILRPGSLLPLGVALYVVIRKPRHGWSPASLASSL